MPLFARAAVYALVVLVSVKQLGGRATIYDGMFFGALMGLCLVDAALWLRSLWRMRRIRRPCYWWELDPAFVEGRATPACAFCRQQPEDLRPWQKWRKGADGVYRCPDCMNEADLADDAPIPADPLEDSARHADDGCAY